MQAAQKPFGCHHPEISDREIFDIASNQVAAFGAFGGKVLELVFEVRKVRF